MSDFPFSIPRRTSGSGGGGGGGGLPGFTPVLFTGKWTTAGQQLGTRGISPDTVVENEGVTAGYGKSDPNQFGSEWKVSEEMAGIYTFTIQVNATAFSSSSLNGPTVAFEKFLLGRSPSTIDLLVTNVIGGVSETNQRSFTISLTTRLAPEEILRFKWGLNFTLKGGNASFPGAWMSIAKIAN